MSQTSGGVRGWQSGIVWSLAGVTILGQIVWVLVPVQARTAVTALTVVTFFAATATHAWFARGPRWAGPYLAVTVTTGWAVEAIGTRTGQPFGHYAYTDRLGPSLASVPLLIPLAWSMMAYPCLLAAQRLARGRAAVVALGGVLFAGWDLFLDPQMVAEGYWVWRAGGPRLPGIPAIPVHNFAGWLLVALVLMAILDRLPRVPADDSVPTVLLSWVYLSNVLAAAVFFHRPAVAAWGGVAMGLVVLPWWRELRRGGPGGRP